jgi:hypothetical protein
MPGARCTRGLVCNCSDRTHTSNNEYTGTPGIPARNGFNGLCRALVSSVMQRQVRPIRVFLLRQIDSFFD